MSKNNAVEKKNLKFHDLPSDVTKNDIETFLSKYKEQINTITIEDYKDTKKLAKISFKDSKSADDCRINMNLRKIKNLSIRIMWDEKDFQYKNYNKNNLYIKEIPKDKTSREVFEYFHKFGDIYSIKINEDEKGNIVGTGYITYYNQDSAKKAMDETNGKKIWDSNMDLQYQIQHKNDRNYHHYNYNYHNYHSNDNLKICINNIPESFTNDDIQKLCQEFGKIQNNNVSKGQYGKYAIVTFSNEQEAKNAIEKLNNKEIEGKKINVKEFQRKPNYQQNNNYINYFYNQFPRYEEPYENTNLYVRNIPLTAKEEDLRKVFEPFGKIKSIKLEMEKKEKVENGETKIAELNKGFGYILYESVESAKKALESLNNTQMQGFSSFPRPLLIQFFIPKKRREMMENMSTSGYNYMEPGMMYPQPFPGYPPHFPNMIGIPFNQFNQWNQGNFPNRGYNAGYKQKYNKRGGHRGGYYKGNNQRKNMNMNNQNQNQNNNNENNNNNNENNLANDENTKKFDYDAYNKLKTKEEKNDFLGELLFNAILENPLKNEKNLDIDTIGKITGMIIAIPNENEIIEILEKPQTLKERILEALSLITNNK